MNKNYYSMFPSNFFDGEVLKTSQAIRLGTNILLTAPVGFGATTYCTLLEGIISKDKAFAVQRYSNPKSIDVQNIKIKRKLNNLIIIEDITTVENLKDFIQTISDFKYNNIGQVVFFCTAGVDSVEEPLKYTAYNGVFFEHRPILKPLNQKDTKTAIDINCKYYGYKIRTSSYYSKVYALSGGIPRLIKHSLKVEEENRGSIENYDKLVKNVAILYELDYLVNLIIKSTTENLIDCGILDSKKEIKSKLLKEYYTNYISSYVLKEFPTITETEQKVLTYLYNNLRLPVSYDKICDLMNMNDYNYSLYAMYKTISRLRPKIKGKLKLKNVRDSGYILEKL